MVLVTVDVPTVSVFSSEDDIEWERVSRTALNVAISVEESASVAEGVAVDSLRLTDLVLVLCFETVTEAEIASEIERVALETLKLSVPDPVPSSDTLTVE